MKRIGILLLLMALVAAAPAALDVTDGLIIHLDAGSITGLSDGDNVTSWADIAPDGQDSTVSQVTINDPEYGGEVTYGTPTYVSSAINGQAAVRFTRPEDLGSAAAADKQILLSADDIDDGDGGWNQDNGLTMFVVATGGGTGDARRVAQFGRKGGQAGQHLAMDLNADRSGARFSNGYFLTDAGESPFITGQWIVAMEQLDEGEAYSNMRYAVDGQLQDGSSNNTNTIDFAANNNDFSIGGGRHPSPDHAFAWLDWYDGDIAEVLVYNAQLSTEDIASVNEYLMDKYAVPEPATLVLLGIGSAGMFTLRRRRG